MKFKWDKKYLGWGLTAFAVIVASAMIISTLINRDEVAGSAGRLLGSITPIFYGIVLAYLLCPIVNFFETRFFCRVFSGGKKKAAAGKNSDLNVFVKNKPARILSIILSMLIISLIFVAVINAILPQLEVTIKTLVNNIPSYITTVTEWVNSAFASFPEIGGEITAILGQSLTALRDFLTSSILPQVGDYLGFLTSSIMSVIGFLMNILLGIVISIYCLYSKELFSAQAKKILYSLASVKIANRFIEGVRKVHHSFGGFITGTLIDSFIVACITFIATTIFRVPFALLVSVIMGITNIIPYFGPFIGAIPCAFLILMESPVECIVFIVIVAVIQNLNGNVLSPRILGESIGLSSFWVIFAILAGQGIFGFWGMIIGIPLFAVIYSAARTFFAGRLEAKGLPSDSDSYTDIRGFDSDTLAPVSLSRSLEEEKRLAEEQKKTAAEEKKKAREERKKEEKAK